jgi:two-component system, OmpR family, sensor histidine kinase TctE
VAAAVIGRHIGRAIDAGVDVDLDAPDGEVLVTGHRTLAFEIVSNLLDNAIRYNRRGGLVVVSVRAGQVAVADDGPGLTDAEIARLGGRFVRLPSSGDREGSGLGFAIVRSAAQRMGAEVVVESTRPGLRVTVVFASSRP